MAENSNSPGLAWLYFSLLTVFSWGVYGVILHKGRSLMPDVSPPGPEVANAGLKAFLFVGVAYFVVAVLGPIVVLMQRGTNWSLTGNGVTWSFIAGVAGALGAFTLVLALGAAAAIYKAAAPAAVMPIVFAGAPIVNTITALLLHPPKNGFKSLPWQFLLGCALAACGAFLVAKFAPTNVGAPPKHAATTTPAK
ncbi:MAG: hypothetical protein HY043_03750 [Verrucomicrobia bacterium]|nr:hypothetical protein [Verrucomicrobiota bacterium]